MKTLKSKWYWLSGFGDFAKLHGLLNENAYSDKDGNGFEIFEIVKKSIKARYILKEEYVQEIIFPQGNSENVKSIRFVYVNFTLRQVERGKILLSIFDSPSGAKHFINKLRKFSDEGLTIEPIQFELDQFLKFMKNNNNFDRAIVSKIKITDVHLDENASARIEIISTKDAHQVLKKNYKNSKYIIDRVSISVRAGGELHQVDISRNGNTTVTEITFGIIESYILGLK